MSTSTQPVPAPPLSFDFAADYLITMRPYLLFVSGITGIVGMSLAHDIATAKLLVLGLAFFSSYGFGQALTDCFQLDTDSLSAPYRPLVRGTVRPRDVCVVSLLGLSLCGLVVTIYNPLNLVPAVLTVAGLATYTPFKRRWWGGPFYNSWIVALVALMGYMAAAGAAQETPVASMALCGVMLTVFFGYANFVLTGYYKDISADRVTGYETFPVRFGRAKSSAVSDLLALASLVGCGLAVWTSLNGSSSTNGLLRAAPFFAGGLTATVLSQLRIHRVRGEREAHRAIAPVVHAYILLLSGISTVHKPSWAVPLAVFYVGFLITMKLRPMEQQI
jgi:4-hydroxybenzoate polyprenyltransferase